ncbi:MAG: alkaline phosphatase family protein [Desulfomonile tiedjei]|nr:alkaline phosphatase family protein [Desulfomonile tiedjei]
MSAFTKVVVLGLDGVPYSLLTELFRNGVMPNLAAMAGEGAFARMDTTLPAVSSVAWASFMTGKNPGRHGIFGFTDVAEDEISLKLPSFDDIRQPAIWNMIPGKSTVVVNLPFTYPARRLDGTLISGFVAPIFERAVYPQSLIPWLRSLDYRIDVDAVKGRQDRGFLIHDLFKTLDIREKVMLSLMDETPWDLFIGVITGTDRLHHFFFDAKDDPTHPFYSDFMDYYRRIDLFFGRFQDRVTNQTKLILLSDHGFTRLKKQVYLNPILCSLGYLSFTRPEPQSLNDIHPDSQAFAMDPTRIYLNTRERFRRGILSPVEAAEVRAKLKHELEGLRLRDVGIIEAGPGETRDDYLFAEVKAKEEIYEGDLLSLAPDLVIIPSAGYDPKAAINAAAPVMTDIFTGMHTHDDAFLIIRDTRQSEVPANPCITDVAGKILNALA